MVDFAVSGTEVDIIPGGFDADAFGRLRVSGLKTLWSQQFRYSISPLYWDTVLTTGGTVTFNSTVRSADIACTASTNSQAVIQSHNFLRYLAGRSHLIKFTCNFDAAGTEFAVVLRNNSSDTLVAQSSFNGDKCDGTGRSGYNIDRTKSQLFIIDFAHLGVGDIRFWVMGSNGPVLMHTIKGPNTLSGMWMQTAVQPIKAEILNNGTNTLKRIGYYGNNNGVYVQLKQASGASSFKFFCSVVESEGDNDEQVDVGPLFGADNFPNGKSVSTTEIPLIAIRPKATFNSITNRGTLIQESMSFFSSSRGLNLRVYLRPTLTNASFASVDNESFAEFDTAATAWTGGYKIGAFAIESSVNHRFDIGAWRKFGLSLDAAGTTADILLVTAQGQAGSTTVYASMDWMELV